MAMLTSDSHNQAEVIRASGFRFGAGLTQADVVAFQTILREECQVELTVPEAWTRAIELLSLVELLLEEHGSRPE